MMVTGCEVLATHRFGARGWPEVVELGMAMAVRRRDAARCFDAGGGRVRNSARSCAAACLGGPRREREIRHRPNERAVLYRRFCRFFGTARNRKVLSRHTGGSLPRRAHKAMRGS